MFLFDTDHAIIIQEAILPEYGRILQRMQSHQLSAFFFSDASLHEQFMGANAFLSRAHTPQDVADGYRMIERLRIQYGTSQVFPCDLMAARQFEALRKQKVRIATMD